MTRKVTKGIFYKCPKCGGLRVEYSERFTEKRAIVFDSSGTSDAGTRRGRDRILEQSVTEQMTKCINCKYSETV